VGAGVADHSGRGVGLGPEGVGAGVGEGSGDGVANTVVTVSPEGDAVRIRDFATVTREDSDPRWLGRLDGRPAVFVALNTRSGTDVVSVSRMVRDALEGARRGIFGG